MFFQLLASEVKRLLLTITFVPVYKMFWIFNIDYVQTEMSEQTHENASIYIRFRKKLEQRM